MNIRIVDPERLIAVCTAVAFGFTDFGRVCEFIFQKQASKISAGDKNHVSRAISVARDLDMISFAGDVRDSVYQFHSANGFDPRAWLTDEKEAFLREKLQSFDPFLRYFDFVSRNMPHSSSAAHVSSLFKIDPPLTGEGNVFRKWGEYAGIFSSDGSVATQVKVKSPFHDSKFVEPLVNDLDSELKARSFLQEWLGDGAFKFVDEDVRKDLVFALTRYKTDPSASVSRLGHALEDHLKSLAKKRGIKLEDAKGKPLNMIGQMIGHLRSNKVLADHHSATLQGLEAFVSTSVLGGYNAYRKMTSHGKNADAQQRWILSSEIALVIALQMILAIRSTFEYVVKNKLSY